ncbi:MAG: (deoxy)nucleoside triphosphate pyrophosphohydrolase [Verrucomicrobia bacterium]|nr:(deoxy)nucleoside triphosphate pyrophosphohydrolase [Verrucomicrobiota bacterium]
MDSTKSTSTTVVCLILQDREGLVLATQRPAHKRLGLLWEFPGGKVEQGEDPESALRREIKEELGIALGDVYRQLEVLHCYDFGTIQLIPFLARCHEHPLIVLHEHADSCWLTLNKWQSLQWAPADIPVIENLLNSEPKPNSGCD